jgi:filamin
VSDAKKVRASGRGLQPGGVRVGDVADFKIYTEGAGEGNPDVRVIGPGTHSHGISRAAFSLIYHACVPF